MQFDSLARIPRNQRSFPHLFVRVRAISHIRVLVRENILAACRGGRFAGEFAPAAFWAIITCKGTRMKFARKHTERNNMSETLSFIATVTQ
jgi:hypothetical protein